MKLLLLIFILLQVSSKAKDCFCETDSIYNEYINCEPKILDNGAMIYWSFNCDSSWLTFENKEIKLTLISFDKDWVGFTGRIGYISFQEFKNTFLYESKRVSGCCQPTEFFLHDKNTGELINELGTGIYTASDPDYPFFLSLSYNNEKYDALRIYNIDKRKENRVSIPDNLIEQSVEINNYMFPEYVFDEIEFKDDTLFIKYHYDKSDLDNPENIIKIDLKKFR